MMINGDKNITYLSKQASVPVATNINTIATTLNRLIKNREKKDLMQDS